MNGMASNSRNHTTYSDVNVENISSRMFPGRSFDLISSKALVLRAAMSYYIGVDVGTGSARAALVSQSGEVVAESSYSTTTYRDEHNADIFEQSTTESTSPCV